MKIQKKRIPVKCRKCLKAERIQTIIDGKLETENTANIGDYIVTGAKGEEYVLTPEKRMKNYETEIEFIDSTYFHMFPKQIVREAYFSKEDFTFVASWGEEMIVEEGDVIVFEDETKTNFYRIELGVFMETYDIIPETNPIEFSNEELRIIAYSLSFLYVNDESASDEYLSLIHKIIDERPQLVSEIYKEAYEEALCKN